LKYLFLSRFSSPAAERRLYREIRRCRVRRIVELGIAMGRRSARLIEAALWFAADRPVHYTGIDLFEARPASCPGMTLKRAHRVLSPLGATIQLIPGDPYMALARTANRLTETDLLLVAADQDPDSLRSAWFYVPRMLHAGSSVFVEQRGSAGPATAWRPLPHAEIARLAKTGRDVARAA